MKLEKELSFKFGCYYDSETQEDCFNKISLSFLPTDGLEIEELSFVFENIISNRNCSKLIEEIAGEPLYIPIIRAMIFSEKLSKKQIERIYYYYKQSVDICEALTFMDKNYVSEKIISDIIKKYPKFKRNL